MGDALFDDQKEKAQGRKPLTKTGKIILGIAGTSFAVVTAVTTPFLIPALRRVCLPFVPATTAQVNNVMKFLEGRSGRLIDLGSGDGRVVIEAAKRGFQAEGIELNPWLVWYSRMKAYREGHDLSKYEHVVIFGVDSMMDPLEVKCAKELENDALVIACRFPLRHSKPASLIEAGVDSVWTYNKSDIPSAKQLQRMIHMQS